MVESIRERLGLTTLRYQTLDDMVQAIGLPREKLCTLLLDRGNRRRRSPRRGSFGPFRASGRRGVGLSGDGPFGVRCVLADRYDAEARGTGGRTALTFCTSSLTSNGFWRNCCVPSSSRRSSSREKWPETNKVRRASSGSTSLSLA